MRGTLTSVNAARLVIMLVFCACGRHSHDDSDGPPEWILVGQDADSLTIYSSTARPDTANGHLRARFMAFDRGPQNAPSRKSAIVSIWQVEYDCANHRSAMRAKFTLDRTQRDTLDRVIYPSPQWHSDSEGAMAQLMAQSVCSPQGTTKTR